LFFKEKKLVPLRCS